MASSEGKQDKIVTEEKENLQGKCEMTGKGRAYTRLLAVPSTGIKRLAAFDNPY